ncbi:MAG: hypothetical protein Q6373_024000 [Candidatus Sigynarchaeota archaeon]
MGSRTLDHDIKARNEIAGFLLLVLLFFGVGFFVIGIAYMNIMQFVLGLSLVCGFVVLLAVYVQKVGGWERETLYRQESPPSGE